LFSAHGFRFEIGDSASLTVWSASSPPAAWLTTPLPKSFAAPRKLPRARFRAALQ
jgi:hypothetical protein